GDLGTHHPVADAQAREPVGLGERARHDEVRQVGEPLRRLRVVAWREVLVVRLVEHHDDVARHRFDEAADALGRDPRAGGIVRVGHEHDSRRRRDRGGHRVEVVAEVARRHGDAARAARLRGQRIDDETVLRVDRLVARLQERVRDELEDVVAAVAEHDRLGGDAEACGDRRLECEAVAVGIARDLGHRRRHRGRHRGARSARVLVGRELDDRRGIEAELARELVDRLAGDVRRNAPDVRRRPPGDVSAHRALDGVLAADGASGAGYEPSSLTCGAIARRSASAEATFASLEWPATSTKKRYSHSSTRDGRDSTRDIDTPWRANGSSTATSAPGLFGQAITTDVWSWPEAPAAWWPSTQ